MKQTSIEWLANQILDNWNDITAGARNIDEFIQQAKEMHKQEIINAFHGSYNAEHYYYETYGGNK